MRILMFYHSVLSDWNHGNAHFLRGVATELITRGHEVQIFEPRNAWSVESLVAEHGEKPIRTFRAIYPALNSVRYDRQKLLSATKGSSKSPLTRRDATLSPQGRGQSEGNSLNNTQELALDKSNLEEILETPDLVIVHEWNDHELVKRIGEHRRAHGGYKLLFHDTHHRTVTAPETMARYDLSSYDGVLAYGNILKELYEKRGNVKRVWTWHEAADTRVFQPLPASSNKGELVWIGNWGDNERTAELNQFLIEPARDLKLKTRVHGVRYPDDARKALADAGIEYAGWLPNFDVPRVFSEYKVTIHVPRRPYVKALPGIPTIRPFEALACGIPLICSPWDDVEGLFRPGKDFLVARNGIEMKEHLRCVLNEPALARSLVAHGLKTVRSRHTCAHRVNELLNICKELNAYEKRT